MSVPSDGGGKAREWTLEVMRGMPHVASVEYPRREIRREGTHEYVVVVEKEWADRQLAEALDAIEEFVRWFREHDGKASDFGRFTFVATAEDLLAKHGRPPDDS